MNGAFCQFGQHLVATQNIQSIDLAHPRPANENAPGTIVRVWLNTQNMGLTQLQAPGTQAPGYLDFRGKEAVAIRKWCAKSVETGLITAILTGEEEEETAPKTRAAGKS